MRSGSLPCSLVGVLECPVLCRLDGPLLVRLPRVSDFLIQGIIQVGQRHQCLNGEQHRSNHQGWLPLFLEDVEADAAKLVNVGVVDLGSEKNLGRDHGVLIWQEEFAVENATLIRSLCGACDLDIEVSEVLLVWLGINSNDGVLGKFLSFLHAIG